MNIKRYYEDQAAHAAVIEERDELREALQAVACSPESAGGHLMPKELMAEVRRALAKRHVTSAATANTRKRLGDLMALHDKGAFVCGPGYESVADVRLARAREALREEQ